MSNYKARSLILVKRVFSSPDGVKNNVIAENTNSKANFNIYNVVITNK